jgi:hypothetical protein
MGASQFLDNFAAGIDAILLTPRFNEGIWKPNGPLNRFQRFTRVTPAQ